jgi:hypothetical protein
MHFTNCIKTSISNLERGSKSYLAIEQSCSTSTFTSNSFKSSATKALLRVYITTPLIVLLFRISAQWPTKRLSLAVRRTRGIHSIRCNALLNPLHHVIKQCIWVSSDSTLTMPYPRCKEQTVVVLDFRVQSCYFVIVFLGAEGGNGYVALRVISSLRPKLRGSIRVLPSRGKLLVCPLGLGRPKGLHRSFRCLRNIPGLRCGMHFHTLLV